MILAAVDFTDEAAVASFIRVVPGAETGNGNTVARQLEVPSGTTLAALRSGHYVGSGNTTGPCVLLENDPTTACTLVAPGVPAVTAGAAKFSATWTDVVVTGSRAGFKYKIDSGAEVDAGNVLLLTDVAAAAGDHTLTVWAYSTSGAAGTPATSATFTVTAPVITGTQMIVSVDALNGSRNDLDGVGFKFQPQVSGKSVTAMGFWVTAGNSASHALRIYASDGTTVLAGPFVVNTSGAPTGAFLEVAVSPPLALTQFSDYLAFADTTPGGDFVYLDANVTAHAWIQVNNSLFRQGGGIANFEGSGHNAGPLSLRLS